MNKPLFGAYCNRNRSKKKYSKLNTALHFVDLQGFLRAGHAPSLCYRIGSTMLCFSNNTVPLFLFPSENCPALFELGDHVRGRFR